MFDGGYINDSMADEPQQLASSVSVGGDDKSKSITAVSIAQIVKFTRPNEGLIIHKKKVYHVNLVAFVYEILDVNPQKVHVLVDDFTSGAPIEVSHICGDAGGPEATSYRENIESPINDGQPRSIQTLKQGDYIRAIGLVKYSQDKPNIIAYSLRIVDDPNEVTTHGMEVIRDSMFYERQARYGNNPPPLDDKKPGLNQPLQQQHQQATRDDFGRLSNRDKHILKFLKEKATTDRGVHVDDICNNLKAFPRDEVMASLEFLSTEGLCWVGDIEDTWCVNND